MKRLFIDIETAPAKAYIWDLKTRYVPVSQVAEDGYILCFAYYWEGDDHAYAMSLWDDGKDAMIKKAWDLLDEADHVITYNGKGFDVPRLKSEFLVAGLGPYAPFFHTDLYQEVKQFRVLSKSMNHMLKLLSLDSKLEHKGFALWTGCMEGVVEDQDAMLKYNLQDVVVMPELYEALYPWMSNVPNESLYQEYRDKEGKLHCRCGSTNLRFKAYKHTKVMRYKQYQCKDCKSWVRERHTDTSREESKTVATW
jgi:hypothetical protein